MLEYINSDGYSIAFALQRVVYFGDCLFFRGLSTVYQKYVDGWRGWSFVVHICLNEYLIRKKSLGIPIQFENNRSNPTFRLKAINLKQSCNKIKIYSLLAYFRQHWNTVQASLWFSATDETYHIIFVVTLKYIFVFH